MDEFDKILTNCDDEILNFDKICRLCMKSKNEMKYLFQNEHSRETMDFIDDFRQMIMNLTIIKIVENDGLPSLVCMECVERTHNSFEFKKQCEYSDYQLKKYLNKISKEKNHERECVATSKKLTNTANKRIKKSKKNNSVGIDECKEYTNESTSDIDQNYLCTACSKTFVSKIELKKHYKNEHKKNSKLTCEICNQTFAQAQTLSRHKKTHEENQKNNLCTICGKSFHRRDDLRRHMRIHTNERPYSCSQCPKSYKQSSELTDHLKSHSTVKLYICTECGKSLATRNGLYVHMKVHRGEKNHECKVCGNKYVTTGELTSHMNHIHSKAKPYVCSYEGCSKAFVTKLSLVTHTRSHTGEKPYQCEICNKHLATASSLHDHKRTHTGEKLKTCDTCGLKLGNAQALKKHLRIHSGERPYHCNICLESFICSSSLSSHVKIKHMDKEHQCVECKKMFALPSKLRQHIKIHNNKTNREIAKNEQDTLKNIQDSKILILDYNKTTFQDSKVNQIQHQLYQQQDAELFKANQTLHKITFNTSDCEEECKKVVQLPLEIQNDVRLTTQIVPVAQISMPQMIISHYL